MRYCLLLLTIIISGIVYGQSPDLNIQGKFALDFNNYWKHNTRDTIMGYVVCPAGYINSPLLPAIPHIVQRYQADNPCDGERPPEIINTQITPNTIAVSMDSFPQHQAYSIQFGQETLHLCDGFLSHNAMCSSDAQFIAARQQYSSANEGLINGVQPVNYEHQEFLERFHNRLDRILEELV